MDMWGAFSTLAEFLLSFAGGGLSPIFFSSSPMVARIVVVIKIAQRSDFVAFSCVTTTNNIWIVWLVIEVVQLVNARTLRCGVWVVESVLVERASSELSMKGRQRRGGNSVYCSFLWERASRTTKN